MTTFDMTEFVKDQQAAPESERATSKAAPAPNAADPQDAKQDKAKRPYYSTQDQTSLYEEYLFGKSTYAQGAVNKTWSDSMAGRVNIRLISRGIFGAAAFTWGGRFANHQLQNYVAEDVRFNLETLKAKPLQLLAKTFDTVLGEPIKAGVRLMVSDPAKKEIIANRAVRFRQKAYYHEDLGKEAGRTLGAEMVAVSFDFACASTADSAVRSIIQQFDPNIQKSWRDKDGHLDIGNGLKELGSTAWRIFSKNQGEDWAAALPYVYQMKLQRNAIARFKPGFKLASDMQINGASSIINREGQIIGDFQKHGALDLQLRFMGYNWYTLMYREAYDAVSDKFHQWKKDGFKISMPEHFNPISSAVEGAAHATRYVMKSAIKSGLYMAPSVPFFWAFRTPQTKWRAPLIYDNNNLDAVQNAYVLRKPGAYQPNFSEKYGAAEFQQMTYDGSRRVWQGGTHTNDKQIQTQGYFGRALKDGANMPRPITPMGGDEIYKLKNQKTLFSKLVNPFGWVSYHTGSGFVRAGDWLAQKAPNWLPKGMQSELHREVALRTFVDASYSYTPYMIAKAEFALRVDDRGAGGSLGEMDKAIYKGIDSFVTLDMKGLGQSARRIGDLLFNNDRKVDTDTTNGTPSAQVNAANAQISQLSTPTQRILAHPELNQPDTSDSHVDKLAKQRNASRETFLYPESRTLQ